MPGKPDKPIRGLACCQICGGGSRYLLRLSNGAIIAYCDESECVWDCPDNIGWDGAVSDEDLERKHGKLVEELSEDGNAPYLTLEEALDSEWRDLVRAGLVLTHKEAYDISYYPS